MNYELQPFPLVELIPPTLTILILGFLIALWITQKPHWSLFVAGIKASLFLVYYNVFFDGTFTFLDDWNYLEKGQDLIEQGVRTTNLLTHLPVLFSAAGGKHFVYYLYNAESFRLLGEAYYAPVTLNILLTFVAAGFMAVASQSGLFFNKKFSLGLFVFLAIHPDVLAWSTIMNAKGTLVLTATAATIYAVSLSENQHYAKAALLAMVVGVAMFFTRYYIPLMLMIAFMGTLLLSSVGRHRPMLWLLVPAGLMGLVSVLGVDGFVSAYDRFQQGFVNPLYGIPRILLTPIPFHTTDHYAFLNLPQVFHWAMMPALVYGIFRVWQCATLTARFAILYFLTMILLYGMFGNLQGPRHRYQLDCLIALFQFYGSCGIANQLLTLRGQLKQSSATPPHL